jgi:hypothetical protein
MTDLVLVRGSSMYSTTRMRRGVATTGLAGALALGLAACGAGAVAQADVEEQIRSELGASTATCPDDLPAEIGSRITCTATADGETFDVTATVRSIQGDSANFRLERVGGDPPEQTSTRTRPAPPTEEMTVDPASGAVAGQDVAQAVFDELTAIVGQEPDAVRCPDLPAAVGSSIRCELDAEGETFGVTVTVTAVRDTGRVEFDIQVDDTPS